MPVTFSMAAPARILATWPSPCRECGEPLEPGRAVYWLRGHGAAHIECGWTLEDATTPPSVLAGIR